MFASSGHLAEAVKDSKFDTETVVVNRPGAPQLDLLTYGKESAAFETHVYLFPRQLDEKVAVLHLPALGSVLTFFAKEHAVHVRVKVEGYRY